MIVSPSFDIHDLKGLEIVILTALLTFSDLNETYHGPATTPPVGAALTSAPSTPSGPPPALPPKPEPRKGVDRVAEMHAVCAAQGEGEANEIMVWEECDIDDYAQYAERLLNVSTLVARCRWLEPNPCVRLRTRRCYSSPSAPRQQRKYQRYCEL